MKTLNQCNDEIFIVESDMTIGNYRYPKPQVQSKTPPHNAFKSKRKKHKIFTMSLATKMKYKNEKFKNSDTDSSFSLSTCENIESNTCNSKHDNELTKSKTLDDEIITFLTESEKGVYCSYNGISSIGSTTIKEYESDESFRIKVNREKDKFYFINPKGALGVNKPLRLFNKNGKPLTDRMGRPLVDILGQPLVVFDDKGLLKSGSKGNQVFNTLGESAIYSNTNLYIPPSEEEPGIPLLDIDKRHIIYLYDNKGHPLTDGLGRPLINASGRPMFGLKPCEKINLNNFKHHQLKNVYSKAPLENFVRKVQIFNSDLKPLTDETGNLLKDEKIICNKYGMPMCDSNGRTLFYKYGIRLITQQAKRISDYSSEDEAFKNTLSSQSVESSLGKSMFEEKSKSQNSINDTQSRPSEHLASKNNCEDKNYTSENPHNNNYKLQSEIISENSSSFHNEVNLSNNYVGKTDIKEDNINKYFRKGYLSTLEESDENIDYFNSAEATSQDEQSLIKDSFQTKNDISLHEKCIMSRANVINGTKNLGLAGDTHKQKVTQINNSTQKKNIPKNAVILFDGSKKMMSQASSMNAALFENHKENKICQQLFTKKPREKTYSKNVIGCFKNALNLSSMKHNNNRHSIYNDYGKPIKDIYGNLIYDKFGMPLTGPRGIDLSQKARNTMRVKLRSIPVLPLNKKVNGQEIVEPTNGPPFYDKYGRQLYDLFGTPNYDGHGRPLTDAFGRPLIDAMGKHLIDSKGNVSCISKGSENSMLTDIFGRRLYEKRGRPLFDSYGRPRFDIFTNAIYDNCGRPATDANGNILYDFLNKPIQPHPENPLYKNARALLPKYIDRILALPCMHKVFKYSRTSLNDVFGGPICDASGRPLYNKLGKPLYDKYGRPLYDKDGRPLCDCYGRPLSEEIRQNAEDQTLSVVDCLKLLKLTEASSKWMEIKQSEPRNSKSTKSGIIDNAAIMNVVQPTKHRCTQYIYALTRVTKFASGRQVVEILEAPLSESTAREMHHLPVDNKPLMMVERQRHRRVGLIKKRRAVKAH